MRKIPPDVRATVQAIERAASEGRLYPLDCLDRRSARQVFVLCEKVPVPGTDEVDMVPLAELFEGNLFDRYAPAKRGGEGYEVELDAVALRSLS